MQGARKLPQLNLRWPQEAVNLAKRVASENGRSVNEELYRVFMERMRKEGKCNA